MSRSINLAQGPWTNLDKVGLKLKVSDVPICG